MKLFVVDISALRKKWQENNKLYAKVCKKMRLFVVDIYAARKKNGRKKQIIRKRYAKVFFYIKSNFFSLNVDCAT